MALGQLGSTAAIITGGSSSGPPLTQLGAPQVAKDENRLPSSSDSTLRDSFWDYATDIKKERWNKAYPYRLALYKRSKNGSDGTTSWARDPSNTIPPFTLPIAPESLQISTPFAITTTVTLGGIVEEHNGAPLRTITLSGTTGILPLRGNVNSASLNMQSSIFAGTANALGSLTRDAMSLAGKTSNKNVVTEQELTDGADTGTGYYQFKLLERWFDAYAAFKKTAAGNGFIMGFEMWKDDRVYLVTPMDFTSRRSAANPLEYMYNISFKAWKLIQLNVKEGSNTFFHPPVSRDPNKLFQALNALNSARQILQDAKNVLKGIRADINQVLFTPVRQAVLFCKDALGVVTTAVDLPANIITDLKEPILETMSLRSTVDVTGGNIQAAPQKAKDAFDALSIQVSKAEIGGGRVNTNQQPLDNASPANKIAENPDDNFEFFASIKVNQLALRPATKRKIADETRRVRHLKREDFEKARDQIAEVLADFENAVGAGSETYNRVYNLPLRASTREPTDRDYEVIEALNNTLQEFDRLCNSSTINRNETNSIDFIAGLAHRSGIAFKVPKSKFLVPFPYAHTLEQISAMYLGDADRWHEIAALNGLQAPYVDEVGFSLPLLTNGSGNTVTVGDSTQLYVNQQVWVGSTVVVRTKRRITAIEKLSESMSIVTLTGDLDLAQYTLSAGAALQAFLPNTVNSQMSLYIPSDIDSDEADFRQKSIPGVDYFDPLVRAGGVDLLLTPQGDLVVTPDGDTRLAVGLTNIVQKVRLALDTPRGTLMGHPDYGFPIQPGVSTADLTAKDILSMSKDLFKGDPSFSGVESAAILKDGAVVKVSLSVGIAGTSTVIPITVEVPR